LNAGQHNFEGLISKSPSILRDPSSDPLDWSSSGSSVIIYGESGTGKELVANHRSIKIPNVQIKHLLRSIAQHSLKRSLEAELFGYKKGAFTGAIADKKGLFEVADNWNCISWMKWVKCPFHFK
jgi:transcriptional regulator with PAS, ATPase and Fis domain